MLILLVKTTILIDCIILHILKSILQISWTVAVSQRAALSLICPWGPYAIPGSQILSEHVAELSNMRKKLLYIVLEVSAGVSRDNLRSSYLLTLLFINFFFIVVIEFPLWSFADYSTSLKEPQLIYCNITFIQETNMIRANYCLISSYPEGKCFP